MLYKNSTAFINKCHSGPSFNDNELALDVFDCTRADFKQALLSTRADVVIVDGFSASQKFLSSPHYLEAFDGHHARTATYPLLRLLEHVRSMFFVLTSDVEFDALMHDWCHETVAKAEGLYVRLDFDVLSCDLISAIRNYVCSSNQPPSVGSIGRIVVNIESLSEEYFFLDQLYRVGRSIASIV